MKHDFNVKSHKIFHLISINIKLLIFNFSWHILIDNSDLFGVKKYHIFPISFKYLLIELLMFFYIQMATFICPYSSISGWIS